MRLKMIGLAAVAAMALMAFAAPGASANAKVCSTEGKGLACGTGHGNEYSGAIEASLKTGTSATLTTTNSEGKTVSTVTCTTSVVKGTITSGATGTGHINSFTFAGCSSSTCPNGVTATTTASAGNLWPATATKGTAPNGTLGVEKVQGQFICGSFLGNITCVYNTTKATTTVTGGAPATVTATNVPLNLVSGNTTICGSKADWSGVYTVTTPKNLYLT
jgi:hypothetical protein